MERNHMVHQALDGRITLRQIRKNYTNWALLFQPENFKKLKNIVPIVYKLKKLKI
jgi:hypothetical protein